MSKNRVCIVIPVHKQPIAFEIISLRQCVKILGNYPIYIVAPHGLNLNEYLKIAPNIKPIFIEPKWFATVQMYNKLKISRYFYSLFKKYEFLLTHELDAFVFKDELIEWCNSGYSYIGAPWFEGYDCPTDESKFVGVGNSGFSLRNIKHVDSVLKRFFYKSEEEYFSGSKNLIKARIRYPFWILYNFLTRENNTLQKYYTEYEDMFFSKKAASFDSLFCVPPPEKAMKFSFEVRPKYLFELNNNELPFGCHAWWRYDLAFWKPHIEKFGHIID